MKQLTCIPLTYNDRSSVKIPVNSDILKVSNDDDGLNLWILEDKSLENTKTVKIHLMFINEPDEVGVGEKFYGIFDPSDYAQEHLYNVGVVPRSTFGVFIEVTDY